MEPTMTPYGIPRAVLERCGKLQAILAMGYKRVGWSADGDHTAIDGNGGRIERRSIGALERACLAQTTARAEKRSITTTSSSVKSRPSKRNAPMHVVHAYAGRDGLVRARAMVAEQKEFLIELYTNEDRMLLPHQRRQWMQWL